MSRDGILKLSDEPDNLLVILYRLAHRQQENFTTEALAHLVQHLVAQEPGAAVRVLDWLTGSDFFSTHAADAPINIETQARTEEHGIPDIRIRSQDLDIMVEVKLGGGLTFSQANAYETHLRMQDAERTALVALVGSQLTEDLPEGTRLRTWGELGQRLLEERDRSRSELTWHLVDNFVGLLNHLHLMPLRVRSPVSEALWAHRDWANLNPEAPAVIRDRLRNIHRLRDMEHCEPLRNLLLQMDHVLAHHADVSTYLFDSGPNMARPWIGFNVNNMRYFFFLPLNAPEHVTLQRYDEAVDPASFDGTLGSIDDSSSDGLSRWSAVLDLADPQVGYFEADRNQQVHLLSEFFDRAFTYGETLEPE